MRGHRCRGLAVAALAGVALSLGVAAAPAQARLELPRVQLSLTTLLQGLTGTLPVAPAPPPAPPATDVVDVPVSFQVVNRNRTAIPCLGAPDGRTYTVGGTLVAPRALLQGAGPRAVTLYLHGLGYGGWFFRFDGVPGYDYARQQAAAGHASVVIDRLGNPNNGQLPDGSATCFPAQADMADQVVDALRAGAFDASGDDAAVAERSFGRVVLAGHSAGGFIAEIAQYSFATADALAVISYTDLPSVEALTTFAAANQNCLLAPRRANGDTGAPNYAPFGRTDADFVRGHFHDVDPSVAAEVLARRNLDPCGDLRNAAQSLLVNHVGTEFISAPVLLITGRNDALFSPPMNQLQAATAYLGSQSVSFVELPGTGHAVTLGRSHEAFRQAMHAWLVQQGA